MYQFFNWLNQVWLTQYKLSKRHCENIMQIFLSWIKSIHKIEGKFLGTGLNKFMSTGRQTDTKMVIPTPKPLKFCLEYNYVFSNINKTFFYTISGRKLHTERIGLKHTHLISFREKPDKSPILWVKIIHLSTKRQYKP